MRRSVEGQGGGTGLVLAPFFPANEARAADRVGPAAQGRHETGKLRILAHVHVDVPAFLHAVALASGRPDSEDRARVFERGDHLIVVVADGAGGMSGGAAGADAIVGAVREVVLDETANLGEIERWVRVLREVDHALAASTGGETTGAVVLASPMGLVGVSAGDSAAWLISGTGVDDLTAGQRRARLGSGRATPGSFERGRVGGVLVVGTDGIFKYVTAGKIVEVVRSFEPAEAAEGLVELARLPSGSFQDDVAVVTVRLDLPTAS